MTAFSISNSAINSVFNESDFVKRFCHPRSVREGAGQTRLAVCVLEAVAAGCQRPGFGGAFRHIVADKVPIQFKTSSPISPPHNRRSAASFQGIRDPFPKRHQRR